MPFMPKRANLEATFLKDGRKEPWQIRLTLTTIDGRKKRKAFYGATKAKVQEKVRAYERENYRTATTGATYAELIKAWRSSWTVKANTRRSYEDSLKHIERRWKDEEPDSITLPKYVVWLKTLDGSTHDHVRTVLSQLLNFGRMEGIVNCNPLAGIKIKRKAKNEHARCTETELHRNLEYIYEEFHFFFRFLAHTGLRPWLEGLHVTKEDIGRIADESLVQVRESKTEAGRGRSVPITDRFLLDKIDEIESGALFPNMTYHKGRQVWKRARTHSGINADVYGLRSLAISKWSETESLDVVMSRAGHVDPKTTLTIYNEVTQARAVLGKRGIEDGIKLSQFMEETTRKQ